MAEATAGQAVGEDGRTMTDLLHRRPSLTGPLSGLRGGLRPRPGEDPVARPLTVSAAIAAGAAAGGALLVAMAVSVVGWFLADGGAHGQTTGALRVGAVLWLYAHGATLHWGTGTVDLVPLGVTGLLALVCFRSGRWAGRSSQPVDHDQQLGLGVAIYVAVYVTISVLVAVVTSQGNLAVDLGSATAATLLVSLVFGGLGLASGTDRLGAWLARVPGWVRSVIETACVAAAALVACSALLVVTGLVWHFNEAARVVAAMRMGTGDTVLFGLLNATLAPNAAVFGSAYLLGPGFSLGGSTLVSPSVVTLGPVPALPWLAAVPAAGKVPVGAMAVLVLPVLCAALAAGRSQHRYAVAAWDSAALRGFVGGLGAAIMTTVLAFLAGGSLGTGRLAHFGPSAGAVFVAATLSMSLGGLVGGLAVTAWQRRRAAPPSED